jgi:hypothetical protein
MEAKKGAGGNLRPLFRKREPMSGTFGGHSFVGPMNVQQQEVAPRGVLFLSLAILYSTERALKGTNQLVVFLIFYC